MTEHTASEIRIESDLHGADDLYRELAGRVPTTEGLRLELRPAERSDFRLEPAIVVALVAGGAQVLAALVTGLLALAKTRREHAATIRLRTSDGVEIEMPVDAPPERVEELLASARERQVVRLILAADG